MMSASIQEKIVMYSIKIKYYKVKELNIVNVLSFELACVRKLAGLLEEEQVWICRQFKIRWAGSQCLDFLYIPASVVLTS